MLFLNISPSPLKRRLTNDNDDHHHHFPLPFCYRVLLQNFSDTTNTHTHTRIWITPGKKSRKFKVKRLEHDGTKHDYPDDNNDDILVITIIIKWIECSGTKNFLFTWHKNPFNSLANFSSAQPISTMCSCEWKFYYLFSQWLGYHSSGNINRNGCLLKVSDDYILLETKISSKISHSNFLVKKIK